MSTPSRPPLDADALAARLRSDPQAAFELLECGVWQPVIESVVYAGLYQVGNAVLNGTFHQRPRREKYPERKAGHGDA